jgi:hypothetical protein
MITISLFAGWDLREGLSIDGLRLIGIPEAEVPYFYLFFGLIVLAASILSLLFFVKSRLASVG